MPAKNDETMSQSVRAIAAYSCRTWNDERLLQIVIKYFQFNDSVIFLLKSCHSFVLPGLLRFIIMNKYVTKINLFGIFLLSFLFSNGDISLGLVKFVILLVSSNGINHFSSLISLFLGRFKKTNFSPCKTN